MICDILALISILLYMFYWPKEQVVHHLEAMSSTDSVPLNQHLHSEALSSTASVPLNEHLHSEAMSSTALVPWSKQSEAMSFSSSILAASVSAILILLQGWRFQQPAPPAHPLHPWMNLGLVLPLPLPNIVPLVQPHGSFHEIQPFQLIPTALQVLVAINRRLGQEDLVQYMLNVDHLRKIAGWQQQWSRQSIRGYLRSRRNKPGGHLLFDEAAQLYSTDLLFDSPELQEYFPADAPLTSILHLQTIITRPSPLKAIVLCVRRLKQHRGLNSMQSQIFTNQELIPLVPGGFTRLQLKRKLNYLTDEGSLQQQDQHQFPAIGRSRLGIRDTRKGQAAVINYALKANRSMMTLVNM